MQNYGEILQYATFVAPLNIWLPIIVIRSTSRQVADKLDENDNRKVKVIR
jgi:hypothetical protein